MQPDPDGVSGHFDMYIADANNNVIEEIPAATGSQWGVSMTLNKIYVVAGSGTQGAAGDGGTATSADLYHPSGVSFDPSGNLYVADDANSRVQEVAKMTHSQWGQSMTANDIYTVAGSAGGTAGNSGDGGLATSAKIADDFALTLDTSGNMYIDDENNNEIQEVPVSAGYQWGVSMTANDIYTVTGSASGASTPYLNGLPATDGTLSHPSGVAVDSWGDLIIGDNLNNQVREVTASAGSPLPVSPPGDGVTVKQGSGAQTTFQYPYSASITAASCSSGTATISAINSFASGQPVTVSGVSPAGYDGTFTITGTPTPSQFTYALSCPSGSVTVSGALGASCPSPYVGSSTGAPLCHLPQDQGSNLYYYDDYAGYYLFTDDSRQTTQWFNATSGTLLSIADLAGNDITMTYGSPSPGSGNCPSTTVKYGGGTLATSQCDTVTSASGRTLILGFGTVGSKQLVTSVTDPNPSPIRRWQYEYNSSDDLMAVVDPKSNTTSYAYDAGNANALLVNDLTTLTDPNAQSGGPDAGDNEVTAYDGLGRVISQTDPMGNKTYICYSSASNAECTGTANLNQSTGTGTVQVFDPNGNETDYGFSEGALGSQTIWNSDPVSGGTAGGGTATVSVSAGVEPSVGAAVTVTGVNPSSYDCTSCTVTAATPTTISYSLSGSPTYTSGGTAAVATKTLYSSDLSGGTLLTQSTTDPAGSTTTYGYDVNGNQITTTDPMGFTTTGSYSSSTNDGTCSSTAMAVETCGAASPPTPITAGGAITPPSSAPPKRLTYSLTDTDGNTLYTTTGVYEPGGSTAAYSQTTYSLFDGDSVHLNAWAPGQTGPSTQTVTCTNTPPSYDLPCATIDGDGIVSQLAYNAHGHLTSSSTPDGNGTEVAETSYGYDGDGEQTSAVSPDGNLSGYNAGNYTTVTSYDADGNVTSTSAGDGSGYTDTPRTTYDYYDGDGNMTSQEDARGYTTTYGFNADDEQTLVTDPDGNQTLTCYDGDGNTAQTVPAVGVAAGSLTPGSCPTGYPAGYSTRLASDATVDQYDAAGDEMVETSPPPAGQSGYETTDSFFDPAGDSVETTSPPTDSSGPNSVTYDSYDGDGRLTAETTGCTSWESQGQCQSYTSGSITGASWSSGAGGTATITASNLFSPGQSVTVSGVGVSAYDGSFTVSTATSSQFTYSLPEGSSPGSSSGGSATTSGSTSSYCYDPDDDQTAVVAPDGNVGAGGASCATGTITNASYSGGAVTITAANSLSAGQVVAVQGVAASGGAIPTGFNGAFVVASATSTQFTYDVSGNPGTYSSGGTFEAYPWATSSPYQTTYSFDSSGETLSTIQPATAADPSGMTTTMTYDPAGNELTSTDANGVTTTNTYTPGDGVASTTYSGSSAPTVTRTYDASGNQTAMTDGTGSSSYGFDQFGEMTSDGNGAGKTVSYQYDPDGDTTQITYPLPSSFSTKYVQYGYDHADELDGITDFAGNTITIADTPDGLPKTETLPTTTSDSISTSYDSTDSASSIDLMQGSTTLLSYTYSMAPSGDIASETDSPSSSGTSPSYLSDAQSETTEMAPSSGTPATYTDDSSGDLTTLPQSAPGNPQASYDKAGELTSSTEPGTTDYLTYGKDAERGRKANLLYIVPMISSACYDSNGLRISARVRRGLKPNTLPNRNAKSPMLALRGVRLNLFVVRL